MACLYRNLQVGSCFWPILGYLIRQHNQSVFLIGIYWGNKKPDNSNAFIKYFVDEIEQLITHGINVKQYTDNNIMFIKMLLLMQFVATSLQKVFYLIQNFILGFILVPDVLSKVNT